MSPSYLVQYRHFIGLLCLVGVCPFRFNIKTNQIECTTNSLLPHLLLWPIIVFTVFKLAIQAYSDTDHTLQNTLSFVAIFQAWLNVVTYLAILLMCLCDRKKHADFLNAIQAIDVRLRKRYAEASTAEASTADQALSSQRKVQFQWILFGMHAIILILFSFFILNKQDYYWQDHLLEFGSDLFSTSFMLVVIYVENCASFLAARLELICGNLDAMIDRGLVHCFGRHVDNELDMFDEVWHLKMLLEHNVGSIVILNLASDFTMFTLVMYYFVVDIVYGTFNGQSGSILSIIVIGRCFVPPFLKCMALCMAVERLGNQVVL